MKRPSVFALATALVALSAVSPAQASGPEGLFEICRTSGVVSIYDHQPIQLPAGSNFADISDARDPSPQGGSERPVRVVLLQPLMIPASGRCAVVRAGVSVNPRGFPVGPNEHRIYHFSGNFRGPMPELAGQARTEFR